MLLKKGIGSTPVVQAYVTPLRCCSSNENCFTSGHSGPAEAEMLVRAGALLVKSSTCKNWNDGFSLRNHIQHAAVMAAGYFEASLCALDQAQSFFSVCVGILQLLFRHLLLSFRDFDVDIGGLLCALG